MSIQACCKVHVLVPFYYAALLPRRGPHIASHSVCLSVRLSVCPSVPLSLPSITSRHLANYNDTHVLFGTHWGPHIVRPSRPHKFLFLFLYKQITVNITSHLRCDSLPTILWSIDPFTQQRIISSSKMTYSWKMGYRVGHAVQSFQMLHSVNEKRWDKSPHFYTLCGQVL